MSMLPDVTGTGEGRGKGKAPKDKGSRIPWPGHMVKNHVTVIWQDGELLKEEKDFYALNFKGWPVPALFLLQWFSQWEAHEGKSCLYYSTWTGGKICQYLKVQA